MRALVAESSPYSAESLAFTLLANGYQAFILPTGHKPMEMADRVRPDILLVDAGAAEIDAVNVCRAVRASTWGQTTCIIALADFDGQRYLKAVLEAGCNHYLLKPVRPTALQRLIAVEPQSSDAGRRELGERLPPLSAGSWNRRPPAHSGHSGHGGHMLALSGLRNGRIGTFPTTERHPLRRTRGR